MDIISDVAMVFAAGKTRKFSKITFLLSIVSTFAGKLPTMETTLNLNISVKVGQF